MDHNRLKELAGRANNQNTIDQLIIEKALIVKQYDEAIAALKDQRTVNEGLFSTLSAAVGTVAKIGKKGAEAVAGKVRQVSGAVKEIYLDQKAKAELKELTSGMKEAISDFAELEKKVPTLLKRDKEVADALTVFKDLFNKTLEIIGSRAAVTEGAVTMSEINDVLISEGLFLEGAAEQDMNVLKYVIVKELGRDVAVKGGVLIVSGFETENNQKADQEDITDKIKKLKSEGKLRSASVTAVNDFDRKIIRIYAE